MKHLFFLLLMASFHLFSSCSQKREVFNENGAKIEEFYEKNGRMTGVYRSFYESGNIQTTTYFKEGSQQGPLKVYYENGKLKKESNFNNGKESGPAKFYYENGQLAEESSFKNGTKEGPFKEYHQNGTLKAEGIIKNDKANGVWKIYNENGKLVESGNFIQGNRIGKWKIWYPFSSKYITVSYYNDSLSLPSIQTFELNNTAFTIRYPSTWEGESINKYSNPLFVLYPKNHSKAFRENIVVSTQTLPEELENLEDVVEHSKVEQIISGFKTVSSKYVSLNGLLGKEIISIEKEPSKRIKTLTQFFIYNNLILQVSFAAEQEAFDRKLDEAKKIISSFKLKNKAPKGNVY